MIGPGTGGFPLQTSNGRDVAVKAAIASRLESKAGRPLTRQPDDSGAPGRATEDGGRSPVETTALELPTTATWTRDIPADSAAHVFSFLPIAGRRQRRYQPRREAPAAACRSYPVALRRPPADLRDPKALFVATSCRSRRA